MGTPAATTDNTPDIAEHALPATWALLIYVLPSHPSRLRAAVWRDVKRAGAVYLRDGACALPERPETVVTVGAIAGRIVEFGGQATVVEGARLKLERAVAIVAEARAARATEYADLSREAEAFLAHVERERTHRDFGLTELADLETDLGKLKCWAEQIRARDYFPAAVDRLLEDLFARCDAALAAILEHAYGREAEERP